MYRIATALLMSFFLFAPRGAAAQTLWLCALSEDAVRLVCVAETDPLDEPPDSRQAPASSSAQTAPQTVVNGTAFPLDPRRQYSIDLWSPPTEMDFVEQLAQASLCHRSASCRVMVAGASWPAYSRSALAAGRMASRR